MSKFTTDWILNTGPAKQAVAELLNDVDRYETTVEQANKNASAGFKAAGTAAENFNGKLKDGVKAQGDGEKAARSAESQLRSLNGTYGKLIAEQNKFSKGSEDFDKIQARIDKVKGEIDELGGSYRKAGAAADGFDDELADIIAHFDKVEKESQQANAQLTRLAQVFKGLTAEQRKFTEGSTDYDRIQAKLNRVNAEAKKLGGGFGDEFGKGGKQAEAAVEGVGTKTSFLGSIMSKLGPVIGAVFAFTALAGFAGKVLEITSAFQKYEAVLTNTLGSNSKAQAALQMITDFAATTNFSVQEATEAYIKFANRGIKLTADEMTNLADVANSTGKGLDQLTEAILDAQSSEFERLKEFGIGAKKSGDEIAFTFKEKTKVIKNTSSAITEYILGLGKLEGVSGSTAAISATLGGKLSNLGDAFDKLLNTIGKQSSFVFGAFIDGAKAALDFITSLIDTSGGAVGQLEREQVRVEGLRVSITQLNVGNAERTRLITQLKSEYPGLLGNINAETVSNDELSKAIDKVSESLAGRIILQRKGDEIAKQAESTADALTKKLEAEAKIRNALGKLYLEQAENQRKGVLAAKLVDEATGAVSPGVANPLKQGNQGLDEGAAAGRTLLLISRQQTEINPRLSKSYGDLQAGLDALKKAESAYNKEQGISNGLVKEKNDLTKTLFGSQEKLDAQTAESGNAVKALTAQQRAQIVQFRALVDEARNFDTALSTDELAKLNKALLAEAQKGAKERAEALKDLQKELADLEKQAAAARLALLQKDSKEYLDEVRKRALAEVDVIVAGIKAREKAYAQKGGTGVDADGKLSAKQEQDIATLKEVINKQYFDGLREINERESAKLFDVIADAGQKELEAIRSRYQKEIDAARKAKNEILAIALEQAKDRELIAKQRQLDLAKVDRNEVSAKSAVETVDTSRAAVAKVNGLDNVEVNDKLDEKVLAAEKAKQQALLEVGIEFAKQRVALYNDAFSQEDLILKRNAEKQLQQLQAQANEVGKVSKSLGQRIAEFDILDLLGVAEGDKDDVKQAFAEVMSYVNDFTAQQLDAANEVVERRTEDVESKRDDLNTEIELNKLGFASNVETRRADLDNSKKARAEALKDQQAAQRAQIALDTVTQTVGLISSSVDIIKGFSKIPIIGLPLGIAAVAALFGFFASAKAKALGATKFEQGGKVGGKRHSSGGNKYVSIDGNDSIVEIEEGEHIINRKGADRHGDLLEHINNDNRLGMLDYMLKDLLEGSGVKLSPKLPEKAAELRTKLAQVERSPAQPANDRRLDELAAHAAAIRENTKPRPQITETAEATIIVTGNKTRIKRKS